MVLKAQKQDVSFSMSCEWTNINFWQKLICYLTKPKKFFLAGSRHQCLKSRSRKQTEWKVTWIYEFNHLTGSAVHERRKGEGETFALQWALWKEGRTFPSPCSSSWLRYYPEYFAEALHLIKHFDCHFSSIEMLPQIRDLSGLDCDDLSCSHTPRYALT